ncbi:MAG: hypothetical protein ABL982_15450, partial [Vicinamibacterales bacterium]
MLENPELAVDVLAGTEVKALRKLSRSYQDNPIESIRCSVVRDRDAARHWIELRHTGPNDGAGVIPWNPDDKARFKARTNAAEPHTQALDFLQRRGDLDPELLSEAAIEAGYTRPLFRFELDERQLAATDPTLAEA